jgi:CRP-like cAMP-binding protein
MITKSDLSRNRVLAALPPDEMKRLRPHLQFIHCPLSTLLYNSGETVSYAYFPDEAVISLLATLESGRSVEVTLIGNEGLVGITAALGEDEAINTAVVQIPGGCWKIKTSVLRSELQRCTVLRTQLLSYTTSLLAQVSQTAACNRVHLLEQRLARWLLMVCDRTNREEFPITHEFLSHMLGTPRSEITLAAGTLRKAGIIQYGRGKIRVLDTQALQSKACECYRVDMATTRPR